MVDITIPSIEIDNGLRLLPDLEANIHEISSVPEFKKIDCCINEVDCRTMHWDPDGNGSWNVKSMTQEDKQQVFFVYWIVIILEKIKNVLIPVEIFYS